MLKSTIVSGKYIQAVYQQQIGIVLESRELSEDDE